jgi:hypothetical protein
MNVVRAIIVAEMMETISHGDTVHVTVRRLVHFGMLRKRPVAPDIRRVAFHGDGRE